MSAPELASDALSRWENCAAFWDQTIGRDGNKYWKVLQEPCLGRLLGDHLAKPAAALELATGNGLCARWLADRGASVLATDGSDNMLEIARGHMAGRDVELRRLDVTRADEFEGLAREIKEGAGTRFDIVLMNMAIMDIATLEPLAQALPGLLAHDGVFVGTILHPVFFTSGASKNIQVRYSQQTGELEVDRTLVLKNYMSVPPAKGIFKDGQPQKQLYFHRPMGELFVDFFRAGLVVDAIEELAFTEADRVDSRIDATCNFTELPVILAFRLRAIH
ncbi:S-adenosyl-L-methionine-dependent methyltransferase [Lasiosphaeris hirsuta]|uniref:S-adenosyl-L-methionine-dependent methyltransferase n=1 Tax=Lasiosphaeris hirsuta TaxID=260670 RepID=A0AA40DP07_9PEZI|nr:S-adenosyl-L-methionine-dependent methyltransferase [Lasiosphaeris hirsuta]